MEFNPKKLSVEIKKIADSLPDQYEVQNARVKMTGNDIHLSGINSDEYENDGTEYLLTIPIYIEVNHKRKLANAYKKQGMAGIIKYVNACYQEPII